MNLEKSNRLSQKKLDFSNINSKEQWTMKILMKSKAEFKKD